MYAGYEYLDSVDLYDLNARYYNPKTARFLSEDPYFNLGNRVIGLYEINVPSVDSIIQANNIYAYCGNRPVMYIDFSGENTVVIGGMFGSFAGPVGTIIGIALGTVAGIIIVVAADGAFNYYKEHTKGSRPSTEGKHEKGQARKKRDAGGEKGDSRRTPRKDPKKSK